MLLLVLLSLVDLGQTLWMAHGGSWDRGFHETNRLLGLHPSVLTLLLYTALCVLGFSLVSKTRFRKVAIMATVVVEIVAVFTNFSLGVPL